MTRDEAKKLIWDAYEAVLDTGRHEDFEEAIDKALDQLCDEYEKRLEAVAREAWLAALRYVWHPDPVERTSEIAALREFNEWWKGRNFAERK